MNLNEFISYATFDLIGEIVFSKQFGFLEQARDVGNAIGNSLALNDYIAIAGYFRWINIALLANPLLTWLSIMSMGHLFDTVKAVMADREKNHPDKISVRDIGTQALAAVGAGSDTVAAGIQSFVYHMIRHPNAWKRAHKQRLKR
ncbi:hypothetical protein T440DRAFT_551230 [Plenodomus tracheiphilus IPT5]|uniref:Cytochrome P450 n=1 Tax=Plenodomus tracheiphilus IPT5 TaxID=1408161 RepID=A0A6A7BI58_9PLEO|nr:hypothetical protein T440DRAFT_551230 [Plenodomus tracheiphilus IPT5]